MTEDDEFLNDDEEDYSGVNARPLDQVMPNINGQKNLGKYYFPNNRIKSFDVHNE